MIAKASKIMKAKARAKRAEFEPVVIVPVLTAREYTICRDLFEYLMEQRNEQILRGESVETYSDTLGRLGFSPEEATTAISKFIYNES